MGDYAAGIGSAIVRERARADVLAAQREAEKAIRARSEFLANMNHELRTPLNAIIGFSTMLRDMAQYNLSDDQRTSYADYILQSADLLLGHINTILEVAALDTGKVEIEHDDVELGDQLNEALRRASVRAAAADVTLERRDSGEPVRAWADGARAAQAIDHILQIAIKSCDAGGRVMTRARFNDDGNAEIAVRDNGAGFSADDLAAALTAFDQPNRGLDQSFAGPGVGFALAKTFIEMQGGQFHVESREGQGTLVVMSFPTMETQGGETGVFDTPSAEEETEDDAA